MASPNTSFDYLATTTLQNFSAEIADNYTNHIGLLWFINKGNGKRTKDGGRKILEGLSYKVNDTFGMIAKTGTIATTPQDTYTNAEFDWKYAAGTIAYYDPDVQMNRGKNQVYDLLMNLKKDAMRSITETIAYQLYQDDTTITKNMSGLQLAVAEDPTTGTYGGINRATAGNEFWRNYYYSTAVTAFNTSNAGQTAMNTTYLNLVRGTDKPTVWITTMAIWALYQLSLTTNVRYSDTNTANAGFVNLLHMDIPVIFDYYCPTGNMYCLNTNHLFWNVMSGRDAWVEGFYPSDNQLTYSSKVATYGNLSCDWAKGQGVVNSVTG
jgi:hypothetical protein